MLVPQAKPGLPWKWLEVDLDSVRDNQTCLEVSDRHVWKYQTNMSGRIRQTCLEASDRHVCMWYHRLGLGQALLPVDEVLDDVPEEEDAGGDVDDGDDATEPQ